MKKPVKKPVCSTCGGLGTIDETLGGEAFSSQEVPCPDCTVNPEPAEPKCDYDALDHLHAMLRWLDAGKNPFTGGVG